MTLRPVHVANKADGPAAVMQIWEHLKSQETGEHLASALFGKISIQIEGEFDGATVAVEGSNDGDHWYTLIDTQDNHMRYTAPGMGDIGQLSRFIRPMVLSGDTLTDISIFALCRGI